MLVLVIIGLMSSAVVMTLPKDPPASRALSDTLLKEFNRNAQDSLLSARSAAFGVSKSSYAFYDYDGAEWISKGAQSWPNALQVHLIKEGEAVTLTDKLVPLIIFEPTGNSTVFSLTLSDFDGRYVLLSNGDGRVTIGSDS